MKKLKIGQKAFAKIPLEVKKVDKENFTLTMVASTQDTDRHGDVIVQAGWNLDQFIKNPVILNSHNYYDATEVIANATRTEVKGKGKKSKLEQDWKFAVNENPKAKIIFDLYAGGFLHASSVGFIPRKFKENEDGSKDYFVIEEAELLEVSAVSVPANAYALAKQKGIDVDKIIEDDYDKSKNKNIDTDEGGDEEDSDDEDGEDNEVQAANEKTPTEDSDNSKGEPTEDNDKGGADAGDGEDQEDVSGEEEKPEEKTVVKKKKYIHKISDAIINLEKKRKANYQRASKIIDSLLNDNEETIKLNKEINEQIRKRKVNKVIRELLKTK